METESYDISPGINNGAMGDFNHVGNGDALVTSPGVSNGGSVEAAGGDNSTSDRIAALELVVSQQADDLLCLKTALADVVRRLQDVESRPSSTSTRGSTASSSHKPAKETWSDCTKFISSMPLSSSTRSMNRIGLSSSDSRSQPVYRGRTPFKATSRSAAALPSKPAAPAPAPSQTPRPPSSRTSTKKPAMSSTENLNASHVAPTAGGSSGRTSKKIGSKELSIEKTEGLAKMYLKGRAVTMYAPTEQKLGRPNCVGKEPSENLTLKWVMGYRGKDCRNNIVITSSGELCYFTAAVAILYNPDTQEQRFYQEHTDDIKSVALHPDQVTVATGQVAGHAEVEGKPHVRIWNSATLETLCVLGEGSFSRAVGCLSFAKENGGELLCAVDESNEHVVSVWNWKTQKQITEQKGSADPVGVIEWHPKRMDSIVMCGKSSVIFWTFAEDKLTKKSGIFEKYEKPKFVTCTGFMEDGSVLTGDTNGNIFIWNPDEHKIKNAILGAHDGPLFALLTLPNNHVLSGGQKDLLVSLYDLGALAKVRDVTMLPENVGGVRQIAMIPDSDKVYVGTTRNCIFQGPLQSEEPKQFTSIMTSHFEELWGIALHPSGSKFITCGMDKLIIMWDLETRQPLWTKVSEYQLMCVGLHPTEEVGLFGTVCGKWFAMDLETKEVLTMHPDSKEQYDCAAYSPDGTLMAIGSHDNGIYVYKVSENGRKYNKVGKCIGHTSFVTHIDWSSDSQYLRSNSGDYEILYWTAGNCKQCIDVQSMRDLAWHTETCVLGYNVMGIWPEGADGTDINGCDRSHDFNFVATADDFGKVKLFNYPCYTPKAAHKTGMGHSSHVTRVRFFPDNKTLLSLGGQDSSVLLWNIG